MNLKQSKIFRSIQKRSKKLEKNKQLVKQILFTLFCLFVFRFGSNLVLNSVQITGTEKIIGIELLNLLTGADMTSFTVFALGISPFITGSIIIELLGNDVIPVLTRWKKNDETKKTTTASNVTGLVIAFVQATGITLTIDQNYSIMRSTDIYSYIYTVVLMVAGSCFLLWIAKMIDTYGIGNGSSLIIAAGILYNLPSILDSAYNTVVTYKDWTTFLLFGLLMVCYIAIISFIVFIERSERRVTTMYAQGKNSIIGNNDSYLPIKINVGGVVPVIFASSILQTPTLICNLFGQSPSWLTYLSTSNTVGIILYSILIIFFVHFYAHTLVDGKSIASSFKKQGCNIISVRAGKDTEKYINKVVTRVSVFGSLALLIVALIPIVLPLLWSTASDAGLTLGGTSLIITTGVIIDLYTKIKAETKRKEFRTQSIFWR